MRLLFKEGSNCLKKAGDYLRQGEGGCSREGYYSRKYDGILTENGIWCSHINRMNDKNSKEDYPTLKPTFPENFQTEK